jgi:molybdopterin-guanine dinucleotide biosynthesis protein A
MNAPVSGIILAGGGSRRMGADKRSLALNGKPLLAIAIELVAAVSDDVIVSCQHESPPDKDVCVERLVKLAFDLRAGGPLAGLEAALPAAQHDLVLVIPVDMPGLTVATLTALVDAARARPEAHGAAFEIASVLDPFPGAYRRSILPIVSGHLDAGHFRVRDLLRDLDVESVVARPDVYDWRHFLNVNTPADLARAENEF